MFSTEDTIVAIATPPGRGGLGVVRVSGPRASAVAAAILTRRAPLEPRRATLARVVRARDGEGGDATVDRVIATFFPRPGSYTGEDTVELAAHGSPVVLREILRAAVAAGARLAEPGEFTLRAFLNGRIDLVQAEAVADLVEAVTPLQARAACDQLEGTLTSAIADIDRELFDLIARFEASLDFPDEGYHFVDPSGAVDAIVRVKASIDTLLAGARRGRLIREGVQVAILGKPNVGKSSLFNHLLGADRAIVTAIPGTTRDLLTETADIGGLRVSFVDTAGIREAGDPIEAEGMSRAKSASTVADAVVLVLDRSQPLEPIDRQLLADSSSAARLVVVNKIDLVAAWSIDVLRAIEDETLEISLLTGEGLDALGPALARTLEGEEPHRETAGVTNIRHIALLERARAALSRAVESVTAASGALSEEFVLVDLQEARSALEEITGRRTAEDVLRHIFERFCIGK